jgi:hypothetical protein
MGPAEQIPGQKVARAWLDIITALLSQLYYQQEHIDRGARAWDSFGRSEKNLTPIVNNPTIFSPNVEQFLEFYPDVAEFVEKHRTAVGEVRDAMETLYDALLEQRLSLQKAYDEIFSAASREQLFEAIKQMRSVSSPSEEDITQVLFGSYGIEHNFSVLASHIVNRTGELHIDYTVAPLWNLHREKFIAILSRQPYCRMEDEVNSARLRLRRIIDELSLLLKEKRRELAIKFGEPYTVSTNSTDY